MEPRKIKGKRTVGVDCLLCGSRRLAQRGVTIITQRSRPKETDTGSIKDVVMRHNKRERRKQREIKYLKASKRHTGRGK